MSEKTELKDGHIWENIVGDVCEICGAKRPSDLPMIGLRVPDSKLEKLVDIRWSILVDLLNEVCLSNPIYSDIIREKLVKLAEAVNNE